MTARYLILLGCTAGATALLTVRGQSPTPDFSAQAASTVEQRVRIEHDIVRIQVTPANFMEIQARHRRAPAASVGRTSRVADPREPSDALTRAVRRIIGDGRYTPQPFPRPNR
jgi:hypothetical protein